MIGRPQMKRAQYQFLRLSSIALIGSLVLLLSIAPFTIGAAADELERSVTLMARIGSCSSPSFSPDGKQLAFVSNMTGVPEVWTISVSGGFPKLVTALDDPVGSVGWSPDGEWLAFNIAPGGGFNEQIYVVRPDGTALRRLTEGGKENNFIGGWTHDSRIMFSSSRRNPAATDAYLLEPVKGELR